MLNDMKLSTMFSKPSTPAPGRLPNRHRVWAVFTGVGLSCAALHAPAQPVAILSHGLVTNLVGVTYNTNVTDTDISKYSFSPAGITVNEVRSSSPTNLTLVLSGLTTPTYQLTYTGVPDEGGVPGSGTIPGTNDYGLSPVDVGTAAFLPSSYDSIGTPEIPDLTRVRCVGEQIEYNFNFLYKALTGNFDLRVNLRGGESAPSPNNNRYGFGGVAVRTGLDEDGLHPYLFMGVGLPNSSGFPLWLSSYRSTTNGGGVSLNYPVRDANVFPNAWLRITRHEQAFNTYYSTNGVDWISSSGDVINNWPATLYLGIASCGYGGQTAEPASTFDYGNFSITALPPTTNALITITQQPTNTSVLSGHAASFSVAATVAGGNLGLLQYQWRSNSVDIAGATSTTYSIPVAVTGATYSVVISSPQAASPVVSSNAVLTIIANTTPATAVLSYGLVTNQVGLTFSDVVTDTNASKYSISQLGAAIETVRSSTPTNLTLLLSGLTNSTYTLGYTNVMDAGNHTISGAVGGTNQYQLTGIDFGTGASLPSSYDSIGTPDVPDLTRVSCVGEQIEYNFNFLYTVMDGDFDLRVNLRGGVSAPSPNNGRYAFGGVVVRTGLDQFSGYLFSGVGLPNSTGLPLWLSSYRPADNAGASSLNYPGRYAGVFPNAWLRITRSGQQFHAYYSTNGVDWINADGGNNLTNDWPSQLYVGLASCGYGGQSAPPASTFDYGHFWVGASAPPINPATITASRSGGNLVLSWTDPGVLQSSTNVAGPYSDVGGAKSPYSVTPAAEQGYYRLRQ